MRTDHVIPLGKRHLGRALQEFVENCDGGRCRQVLDGDTPVKQRRQDVENAHVRAAPVLGSLHHVYSRAA